MHLVPQRITWRCALICLRSWRRKSKRGGRPSDAFGNFPNIGSSDCCWCDSNVELAGERSRDRASAFSQAAKSAVHEGSCHLGIERPLDGKPSHLGERQLRVGSSPNPRAQKSHPVHKPLHLTHKPPSFTARSKSAPAKTKHISRKTKSLGHKVPRSPTRVPLSPHATHPVAHPPLFTSSSASIQRPYIRLQERPLVLRIQAHLTAFYNANAARR